MMEQDEVQELFRRFAAPLSAFISLGAGRESATELSRNLWVAMLGGTAAEAAVWQAMRETDNELFELVQRCYLEEMKPQVTAQQLAALRARYGIRS